MSTEIHCYYLKVVCNEKSVQKSTINWDIKLH